MFFKNDSEYRCSFRTKKEVHDLRPGDCVEVMEIDLLGEPNSVLVRITENEYNEWKSNEHEDDKKVDIVPDKKDEQEDKAEDTEEENKENADEDKTEDKEDEQEDKSLEEQLEDLKAEWEQAKRPNKKAQIAKQIKELQEKIKNQG